MLLTCLVLAHGLVLEPVQQASTCSSDTCIAGMWTNGVCACSSFNCKELCVGCPDADIQCQPESFGAPSCSCKSDSSKCYTVLPPSVDVDTIIVGAAKASVSVVDKTVDVLRLAAHPCVNLKYSVACNGAYQGCRSTYDTSPPASQQVLLSTNGNYTTATRRLTTMAWSSIYQPSFSQHEVRVVPLPVVTAMAGCNSTSTDIITCNSGNVLELSGYDFPLDAAIHFTPVASAPTLIEPFNQLTLQAATSRTLSGWQVGIGSPPSCEVLEVTTGFSSSLRCKLSASTAQGTWGVSIRPLSLPQGSPLTDLLQSNALDSPSRFINVVTLFSTGVIQNVYLGTCMHPDVLQYCTDGTLVIDLSNTEQVTAVVFSSSQAAPTCSNIQQNATRVTCSLVLPQGEGNYGVSVVQGAQQSPQWQYVLNGRGGVLGLQGSFVFTPPEEGKEWDTSVMVTVTHTFQLPQGYRCMLYSTTSAQPLSLDSVAYGNFTSFFTITDQVLLTASQTASLTYGAVAAQLYYAYVPAAPIIVAYYNITQSVGATVQPSAAPNDTWMIPDTCVVSAWSAWSECSKPCNTGTLYRNRTVLNGRLPPWFNPMDIGCPVLAQVENCNTHSCLCEPNTAAALCNDAGTCNGLGMCDCRSGLTGAACDMLENGWRAELLGNLSIVVIVVAILHTILSKHPMPVVLAVIEVQVLVAQLRSPCDPIDVVKAAEFMDWVILFPKPSAFGFDGGDLVWMAFLLLVPVGMHVFVAVMLSVFGTKDALARVRFPSATIVVVSWFLCPLSFHAAHLVSGSSVAGVVAGALVLFLLFAVVAVCLFIFSRAFKDTGDINIRYTKDEAYLDGFYSEVVYSNMTATGRRALYIIPAKFWSSVGTNDTSFKRRWGCLFTGLKEGNVLFAKYIAIRALLVGGAMGLQVSDNYCVIVFIFAAVVHLVFVFLTLVRDPWCGKLQHHFECTSAMFALFLCLLLGAIVLVQFNTKSVLSDAVQYSTVAAVSIMLLLSLIGAAVWLLCRLSHARSLKDVKAYNEFHEIQKSNEVDESVPSEQAEKRAPIPEVVPVNPLLLLDAEGQKGHKNAKVVYSTADDEGMKCVTTIQPNTTVCDIEREEEERAMAAQREKRQREFSQVVYVDTSSVRNEVDLPEIGAMVSILPSAGLRHERIIGCTGTVLRYDTSKSHYVTGVVVDVHPHKGIRRLLPEHLEVVRGDE